MWMTHPVLPLLGRGVQSPLPCCTLEKPPPSSVTPKSCLVSQPRPHTFSNFSEVPFTHTCIVPYSLVWGESPTSCDFHSLSALFVISPWGLLSTTLVHSQSLFLLCWTYWGGRAGRGQRESSSLQGITVLTGLTHSLCFICLPALTSLMAGQWNMNT